MAAVARSLLFVPGHQPARFDKACQSGADAVVLDLEDAVPLERKDEARTQVARWLMAHGQDDGPMIGVRINAGDTPWHAADIAMCAQAGVAALMLPKAEEAVVLRAIAEALPRAVLGRWSRPRAASTSSTRSRPPPGSSGWCSARSTSRPTSA